MKLSTRLAIMIAISAIGLVLVGGFGLMSLHRSLLNERQAQIENLLKMSLALLDQLNAQETAGKLTHEEAQSRAATTLAGLRNGNVYLFARNADNMFVAHVNPDRVGKVDLGAKVADGRNVVQVYRDALAEQGAFAYVTIPTAKPGAKTEDVSDKLNGVTVFKPWNWTIGTGFFVDDINASFRRYAFEMAVVGFVMLAISIGFALFSVRRIHASLGGEPDTAAHAVSLLASGNLNQAIPSAPKGSLIHSLGHMQDSLKNMIGRIQQQAEALTSAAGQIRDTMQDIARATENSSEAAASTAASVEELTVSVSTIADSARETESHSGKTDELARGGVVQVEGAAEEIRKVSGQIDTASEQVGMLAERSYQIGSIANEIKEIAEQTNLLALNAAIEAARAGEQGRGFAVVADEVRKLAERTAKATQEINTTLQSIQSEISTAVASMQAAAPQAAHSADMANIAAGSLRDISVSAEAMLSRIHDVAYATSEQSAASGNIASHVEHIANALSETDRAVRDAHTAVSSLSTMAQDINAALLIFRV
ncbi:MAG TPA: methyl-accepting chemotaxis protein [Rhodocyclaceae bacterium]|nr:methyl-accepting chemotaxis protein [Rhodocyclaceae bacterium]